MGTEVNVNISLAPLPDVSIERFKEEAGKLLDYAKAREVKTLDDVKGATEDLSIIANLKMALEDLRKSYVGPLNDEVKAINQLFKDVSEPVLKADRLTREKILFYQREQERLRQEAERINALKQEVIKSEMELNGELNPDTDTKMVDVPDAAPKRVHAGMGTSSTAQIWKWELTDINLLPNEYKMPDAAKITKLVKAGMREIPGVRIYSEDSLRITPKKG